MHRPVFASKVFIVPTEVVEPLHERGVLQIFRVGAEPGKQRNVHVVSGFMDPFGAVGVHRRSGREAVHHQDAARMAAFVDDGFAIFTECVLLVAFQLPFRYVTVPDERGVPKNEENHGNNDDNPHTPTIAQERGEKKREL